jgi:hypothetical protein
MSYYICAFIIWFPSWKCHLWKGTDFVLFFAISPVPRTRTGTQQELHKYLMNKSMNELINLGLSDSIIHVAPCIRTSQRSTLFLFVHIFQCVLLCSASHLHLNESVFFSESAFGLLLSCLMRTWRNSQSHCIQTHFSLCLSPLSQVRLTFPSSHMFAQIPG